MNQPFRTELMQRKEVARLLGCHPQTVDAMARAGRLSEIMTPWGVRFDAIEVLGVWRNGKPWVGAWNGGKS